MEPAVETQISKETLPRPPLRYWTWLKFWTFSGQRALLWWVGFLFLIGAALFTFVGVTEVIPAIVNDASGLTSKAAWLVYYPGAVGAICFFWTASLVNFCEVWLSMAHSGQHWSTPT